MRWSYILPRFIFLALIWAFFFFAFDPLLKWSLIKGIEKAAGAKAEIAKVRTSFLRPSFYLAGVTVGDSNGEFRNLAEFSELKFNIAGKPLLEKKFIIEEARLSGLKFGTPRKTSAKLPLVKEETPKFVTELADSSKDMAMDRYEDIKTGAAKELAVSVESLGSVKVYEELSAKYETVYAALKEKADFKEYQVRIDAIKAQYKQANKQKKLLKKAKEFAKIKKNVGKLTKDFKQDCKLIEKTAADLKGDLKAADEARKKDIEAVMGKMKMPAFDLASLSKMLAGPAVAEKTRTAFKWLAIARKYMPDNSRKKILKAGAKRGRAVYFPKLEAYPALLIKKLAVSGELGLDAPASAKASVGRPLDYTGTVEGITTQPQVYGKPLTALITGRKAGRALDFKALVDNTGETMKSEIRLKYSGIAVTGLKLGSANSIGADISGGTGSFDGAITLEGEKINGNAAFKIEGARVNPEAEGIKLAPLKTAVINTLSGVSAVGMEITASGTLKDPSISLKTDLAEKLSGAFKSAFGAELEKAKALAQEKVDAALKPYREKLDKLASSKQRELSEKLKTAEKTVSGFGKGLLKNLKGQAAPGKVKLPKIKF
ncbi:MAG: TIGR03545 family protein [Elusimicrobia bacterium]|nr:TIGR03545 family protein [Elusimicrobiota bacterium]